MQATKAVPSVYDRRTRLARFNGGHRSPLQQCTLALIALLAALSFPGLAVDATTPPAADGAAELAKKLSNPVAALISVPFQNNFDFGAGPDGNGLQYKLNIQPVIPISLSSNWNIISRTILPYVYQEDVIGKSSQSGLSDTVQSLFLSPKEPTRGGRIWGAGPTARLPTTRTT